MAASKTVSWSDSKAGYDPGQSQSLTVKFKKRDQGKVTVSYSFHATSLGRDDYTYSQRRNVVKITVGKTTKTFSYQLHGNRASTSKSGKFTVSGVKNGDTALNVYYENDRVGVNTPYYGPKSTGVHSKSRIGTLKIDDNAQYTVTYDKGYKSGNISNVPGGMKLYKGSSYNIPSNKLIDNANHYVFNLGYSTSNSGDVNTSKVDVKLGSRLNLTNNITYYACWYPQTYIYRFFNKLDSDIISRHEYVDLKRSYTYTKPAILLPDLNELTDDNSNVNSEYYKVGYDFDGWTNQKNVHFTNDDLKCSLDYDSNFDVDWKAIKSKINFDYGFDEKIESFDYTYDTIFDFNKALLGNKNTLIRPGYKLVGWAYIKPDRIYYPFETNNITKPYNYRANDIVNVLYSNIKFSNKQFKEEGITLYAVWEYYTTMYIYIDNKWHLALPYVYNDTTWKISLAYDYVTTQGSVNPSWKL